MVSVVSLQSAAKDEGTRRSGAWLPGVGGHTELAICGGLLLCFLDLVGLLAVLLHPVIAFADDPLGLLLGPCGQRRCLETGTGKKGREMRLTANFLVFFATPILQIVWVEYEQACRCARVGSVWWVVGVESVWLACVVDVECDTGLRKQIPSSSGQATDHSRRPRSRGGWSVRTVQNFRASDSLGGNVREAQVSRYLGEYRERPCKMHFCSHCLAAEGRLQRTLEGRARWYMSL